MFKRNLDVLKVVNASLAERLENVVLPDAALNIAVEKAQSEDLIILLNDIPLDSPINPIEACKNIWNKNIQTDLKHNDILVVFGLGLGYLFKRAFISTSARILLYEPNINVLRFVLEYVDFSAEFSENRIFITDNLTDCRKFISTKFIANDKIEVIFNEFYQSIARQNLNELMECILSACEMKLADINTMSRFSKSWMKNTIVNVLLAHDSRNISILKDNFKDKTAIIAAAGPSLRNCVEQIKANRDKLVVFAVNKVFDYLISEGIKPDFTIFLDARHLKNTIESDLTIFNDLNIITSIRSDSYAVNLPAKNKYVLFSESDLFSKNLFEKHPASFALTPATGTAAGDAYYCAKLMGFSKIIYCGLDLAYKNNTAYADNSEITSQNNRISIGENAQKNIVTVKSYKGEDILTRDDYAMFIKQLGEIFSEEKHIKLYNTTDFGAEIAGMEYCQIDVIINNSNLENIQESIDKVEIRTAVTTDEWNTSYGIMFDYMEDEFKNMATLKNDIQDKIDYSRQDLAGIGLTSDCLKSDTEILSAIAKNVFLEPYIEVDLLNILKIFDTQNANNEQVLLEFLEYTVVAINKILRYKTVMYERTGHTTTSH